MFKVLYACFSDLAKRGFGTSDLGKIRAEKISIFRLVSELSRSIFLAVTASLEIVFCLAMSGKCINIEIHV